MSTPILQAASPPQTLYILTTACLDTTGIVAAIAGLLAANNGLITEAQHHDDRYTGMSFMRTAFHDSGRGMPAIEALDQRFAEASCTGGAPARCRSRSWQWFPITRT